MSSTLPIHAVHLSGKAQKVVGMRRIQWTASSGFGGRHGPDSLVGMPRITHSPTYPWYFRYFKMAIALLKYIPFLH